MGIHAVIKLQDLRDINCEFRFKETIHKRLGEDNETYHTIEVTFPNGYKHWFHHEPEKEIVWIDFNYWGTNRNQLEPIFNIYGIPWKAL